MLSIIICFCLLVASPKRSIDAKCREPSLEPLIKNNHCIFNLSGPRVTEFRSKQRLLSIYMKCPLVEIVPTHICRGLLSKRRQCLLVQKYRGNLQKQSKVQIVIVKLTQVTQIIKGTKNATVTS